MADWASMLTIYRGQNPRQQQYQAAGTGYVLLLRLAGSSWGLIHHQHLPMASRMLAYILPVSHCGALMGQEVTVGMPPA